MRTFRFAIVLPALMACAGALAAQEPPAGTDLNRADYGQRLPATNQRAALWWASSGWKISRTRPVPQASADVMLIRAARNEAEAAQLVIRPAAALSRFTATTDALAGPDGATIPAENIEILRVRYVNVTRPTDKSAVAGLWPDPLPRMSGAMDLEGDVNQPLWVRIMVPRDAKAGLYSGTIRLAAQDYSAAVPLRLEVYDFELPDRMTCTTAFGFSPSNVFRYQKLENAADRRAVIDKYFASFSAHHISPYDPAPLDHMKVTWPDRNSFIPQIDFRSWDQAMTRAIDQYHFNSFRLDIPGMGGGTFHSRVEPELLGFRENTPQYKLAFQSYCRAVQEHLRSKGWLDYAYVYWFDEPDPKDYEFVMNGFRKLKEAAPGIHRMLTEQVEPALVGGPDIWCPISPQFQPDKAAERRQQNEKFWWYVCTGPKAPYCTLFIDHPATELRVWLWQTWQRKIDGILVWETNYWTSSAAYPDPKKPQNPYEDPMGWTSGYSTPAGAKRPWGNGDGRFIYPPEAAADAAPAAPVLEGPVDSMRWEMLRDGIEDYEYLAILCRLIAAKDGKLSSQQKAEYGALLEVPPAITSAMTKFTREPEPIEQRRDAIARAIEAVGKL